MLAYLTQFKSAHLILSLLFVVVIMGMSISSQSLASEDALLTSDSPKAISHSIKPFWLAQPPIGQANLSVLWWDVYDSWFYCKNSAEFKAQRQTYSENIKRKQTDVYSELKLLANLCEQAALKIQYNRDIDSDDLVDETKKQWDKLGLDRKKYQIWLQTLSQIWPDIKTGEQLIFVLQTTSQEIALKDASTNTNNQYQGQFFYQNESLKVITDSEFSLAFLAIWLSQKTTEPELRQQLLSL